MGGPYKRKKYHFGDTHLKKRWRLKRRTKYVLMPISIIFKNLHLRDLDEIDADLAVGKVEKLLDRDVDYDKTGLGQFYCVHCS